MFLTDFNLPEKYKNILFNTNNNISQKYVCSFNIGTTNRVYRIYIQTELEDSEKVGLTDYQQAKIYIKFLDLHIVHKTLIHELLHVWMFEYGHNQTEKEYNNEDICEICACSYDFIYDILKKFYESLLLVTLEENKQGKHYKQGEE